MINIINEYNPAFNKLGNSKYFQKRLYFGDKKKPISMRANSC